MCKFHESICNGFGDIWWTDNPIYFSSIDVRWTPDVCCWLSFIARRLFEDVELHVLFGHVNHVTIILALAFL